MSSIRAFVKKIKNIKNIEVILIIILSIVILVAWILSNNDKQSVPQSDNPTSYYDSMQFRIEEVVNSIEGIDSATIAISYSCGQCDIYATDTVTESNGDHTVTTTQLSLVNGKPVVIGNQSPVASGVVVVAYTDMDQAVIKLYIKQTLTTLLDIDDNSIQIIVC